MYVADDVIAKANDTEYGLAAGVFTNDINKAIYVSNGLQAGTVWSVLLLRDNIIWIKYYAKFRNSTIFFVFFLFDLKLHSTLRQ